MIFNNKYYRKGYRTARMYVRLIPVTQDMKNNLQGFLQRIYNEAVRPLAIPIEEDLSFAVSNIKELERKISEYKLEKESLKIKMSNTEYNIVDNSQEILSKLKAEVEELDQKIKVLTTQISENQTEYLEESAKERPARAVSKMLSFLKNTSDKISLLRKEFTPLTPWFLLVLVDYIIAISFFSQVAEGHDFLVRIGIAYAVPFAITLICLFCMQMIFDRIRKLRSENSGISDTMFLLVPILIFIFVSVALLFIRIIPTNGVEAKLTQAIIWLLFVGLVITVGYGLDKQRNNAASLIQIPFNILSHSVALLFVGIAWLCESFYVWLCSKHDTRRGIELKKSLELLKAKLVEYRVEKKEREKYIVNLPKKGGKLTISQINQIKKEREIILGPEIKNIDVLIRNSENLVLKHKETEKKLKDTYLLNLRSGSDYGTMVELNRKINSSRR